VKRTRHTPDQIVRKLREADRLLAEGVPVPEVCRHLEVSVATYQRWRSQYSAMRPDDVARLKNLERENARLKRLRGVSLVGSCGGALVLVHETTKKRLADHGTGRGWNSTARLGCRQVETAVGAMSVVVPDVLLEHGLQVTVTVDQGPVETLLTDCSYEAFGERVRSRCPNRGPDHPDALGTEDIIEGPRELGIAVSDEEPGCPEGGGHGEVAGLLAHPRTVRVCGDAPKMHPSATHLDEEQHVEPTQPNGLDGEEVTGQHPTSLGP
jgi:putative transposase